jgi:fibronectin-binding autotransporter adhesin
MGNFFRSLFGPKKSNSKIKTRLQSRRLELVGLEERITPVAAVLADFTTNTGVLSLTSFSADFSVLANANGTLTVNSTATVIAGSATTTVSSIGNNNYTVSVNSGSNNVKQLSLIGDSNDNVITISSIDSTAFNTDFALNIDTGTELTSGDTLTINGFVALKGTGALTTAGIETLTIAAAGDITAVNGDVSLVASIIDTAGDVVTTAGNIIIGDANLSGNVAINSASGNLTMGTVSSNASNLTINEGTGTVTVNDVIIGTGNLTITTTNATVSSKASAIRLAAVIASGDVRLTSTGDIFVSGVVSVTSINAKSTAGDVIFGNTVTTSAVGGFTSEATLATKATQIANLVDVGVGANALVTGNLISNNSILASITTQNVGNITITGNVDASVAGNGLTLSAATGAITIGGNVGSSSIAFGDLIASGTGTFLASGTVKANIVDLNQNDKFATSITFAKAVTATSSNNSEGVFVSALGAAPIIFSDTITTSGNPATSGALIRLGSVDGAINVAGAITGLDFVEISSDSGAITLNGNVTTSGTKAGGSGGLINISSITGNVLLSGNISTTGTGDIQLRNISGGAFTINGNVSTSATTAGKGDIYIGAFDQTSAVGPSVTINGTVTTAGSTAGDIYIGINGGTATVNQPLTAGPTGDVVFITTLATDVIAIASGANITAGDDVVDAFFNVAGIINLGANITALNDSGPTRAVDGIYLDSSINLTGAVSMKASGTTSPIVLTSVNGAQNLTLEATGAISLSSLGQATALNTVTITNSAGVNFVNLTAANVLLSNTTGTTAFITNTNITSSLTTTANAYSVSFAGTTVLAGAPVFLNTGNVSFDGTTSLTSGATITGGPATVVNLSGIIVSGGAFNIGAGNLNTNIANSTTLNLTSTTNESTIANRVVLSAGQPFFLNGVGTLTLSGDSSDPMHMNGFVGVAEVTNGTINITGKLCLPFSSIYLTNATITGNGEVGGIFSSAASTVAPSGTLTMGSFIQDATSEYKVSVFNPTSASQILVSNLNSVDINNSTLSLFSIASGLAAGNQFTIIDAAGSNRIIGSFRDLPEGATFSSLDTLGNTVTFAISYIGGSGNDVTLTVTNVSIANPSAIPQPMVAGQPLFNFFTAVGADAGGGPMVTVTIDILPGLTTVPTYFSFFAYDEGFTGGVRVAINELDGNSDTLEIITGAGPGGGPNVRVFQFNFPTLTFNPAPVASFFAFNDPSFDGGIYVAGGDVTGDGIGDLLVGAGESGGPRVQVYAGSVNGVITSSPISDFFAYSSAFTGGVVVAAGDRTGDNTLEVITGPASNGGYNIKSFNVAGTGNNPTLIENFFAFNDFTSIGGLSIATSIFDSNPMFDLVIGTTNTQFGVILNQDYEGIQMNPFPGFTGAIRAGFADNLQTGYQAVAAAGPGGGPVISAFSVDPINLTLTQTDSLFVLDPEFTGGLFVAN